jgi:hypothetical protein
MTTPVCKDDSPTRASNASGSKGSDYTVVPPHGTSSTGTIPGSLHTEPGMQQEVAPKPQGAGRLFDALRGRASARPDLSTVLSVDTDTANLTDTTLPSYPALNRSPYDPHGSATGQTKDDLVEQIRTLQERLDQLDSSVRIQPSSTNHPKTPQYIESALETPAPVSSIAPSPGGRATPSSHTNSRSERAATSMADLIDPVEHRRLESFLKHRDKLLEPITQSMRDPIRIWTHKLEQSDTPYANTDDALAEFIKVFGNVKSEYLYEVMNAYVQYFDKLLLSCIQSNKEYKLLKATGMIAEAKRIRSMLSTIANRIDSWLGAISSILLPRLHSEMIADRAKISMSELSLRIEKMQITIHEKTAIGSNSSDDFDALDTMIPPMVLTLNSIIAVHDYVERTRTPCYADWLIQAAAKGITSSAGSSIHDLETTAGHTDKEMPAAEPTPVSYTEDPNPPPLGLHSTPAAPRVDNVTDVRKEPQAPTETMTFGLPPPRRVDRHGGGLDQTRLQPDLVREQLPDLAARINSAPYIDIFSNDDNFPNINSMNFPEDTYLRDIYELMQGRTTNRSILSKALELVHQARDAYKNQTEGRSFFSTQGYKNPPYDKKYNGSGGAKTLEEFIGGVLRHLGGWRLMVLDPSRPELEAQRVEFIADRLEGEALSWYNDQRKSDFFRPMTIEELVTGLETRFIPASSPINAR